MEAHRAPPCEPRQLPVHPRLRFVQPAARRHREPLREPTDLGLIRELDLGATQPVAAVHPHLIGRGDEDIGGTGQPQQRLENTGAAKVIVEGVASLAGGLGPLAILAAVYVMTSALTEFISNNAVAVLLGPIAIGLAQHLGLDPRPFIMAVMFAASASFSTPIGYQTNTFVYGAGGYRFVDFLKVGLPLNLLFSVIAVIVIPLFFPFHP